MTKTVYIIQWETKNETWLGDIYEDDVAAYKAIEEGLLLSSIGGMTKNLSGKVIPVTLYTND